jgi:tetratricopeptide (TPR) repeat protein
MTVIVGSGSGEKSTKKRVLFVVGIVILVAAAGGAGAGLRWLQSRDKAAVSTGGFEQMQQPITDAQDRTFAGDFATAHKELEKALQDKSLSTDDRYELLYAQGATYENENRLTEALAAYAEAAKVKETQSLYVSMATLAEKVGNKEQAIAYYKDAIRLIPQDNPVGGEDKGSYEQKIRDLGGQL